MYPSAGLGAVSAIHDAVALANCIYELPENPSLDDLANAFQLYKNERYPLAKNSYDTSHRLASIIGQNWYNNIIRTLMKYMPKSLFERSLQVMYAYRPQATFLPAVPDRGEQIPAPQFSLMRALARKSPTAQDEEEKKSILGTRKFDSSSRSNSSCFGSESSAKGAPAPSLTASSFK
ncbi:hypothetical protein BGZ76_005669 [Entomortierella beljakovae]|nr:hypothetical protein BGZ76_005669 [Entomortierella beljakovae]